MTWNEQEIYTWAEHLKNGGVGIAPAEGVYGFVADPFNPQALEKLLQLKQRTPEKGFIVLASERADLKFICPLLTGAHKDAIKKYWWSGCPPTTVLLPKLDKLPPLLTGNSQKIAVRRPFIPYMQIYLNAWKALSGHGLLVSTSCNLSGKPAIYKKDDLPSLENVKVLSLEEPLSRTESRIFNPDKNIFLR